MAPRLPVSRFEQRTLPAILSAVALRDPDRPFIQWLEPSDAKAAPRVITFGAFAAGVGRAAAFLGRRGVKAGDRVLLVAENSPEWQYLALGAQLLRAEPAALFASLAAEPVAAIARRVRPRVAFVSGAAQWAKLEAAAPDLVASGLAAVIALEPLAGAALPAGLAVAAAADV